MTRPLASILATALLACGSTPPAEPVQPTPATTDASDPVDDMRARLAEVSDELIAVRRDIHRHPEVAGQEVRTAGVISQRLRALGVTIRTGVGGHGVVAVIEGGLPGPVVAYRADMDAVASAAPDPDSEIASQTPGVRHICGHDIHVAVGLGVAEALVAIRDRLPGTVLLLFQPAEETAQGAAAMIAAGALRDPTPEAILAVHSAPLPVGSVGSRAGMLLPALSVLELTLSGDGDLEAAAATYAEIIGSVTNVAPGGELPAEPVVAGVFKADKNQAGDLVVQAMLRTVNPGSRQRAVTAIESKMAATSLAGVSAELTVSPEAIPATINDSALVGDNLPVLRRSLGGEKVQIIDALTPFFSEDFAFFQQKLPGALYWLGVANPDRGIGGMPHSPDFRADEGAIAVGARAMSELLYDYLRRHAAP